MQNRHDHTHDSHDHDHSGHDHDNHGHAAPAAHALPDAARDAEQAVFHIQNMDCPTEEALITKRLQHVDGIVSMQFNLITRELTVWHKLKSITGLTSILNSLDMAPNVRFDSLNADAEHELTHEEHDISRRQWLKVSAALVLALGSEILAWTSGSDRTLPVIAMSLFAIALGGFGTLKKGLIALRNLSLNMNFLMTLAVIGAIILGQWPEAAMVIVLFTIAEMIEGLSMDRARDAISKLMSLTPETALVADPSAPDQWRTVPATEVMPGMLMQVRPGERIPLDADIRTGSTSINQAAITGESMPVERGPGDSVFAGTINTRSTITCIVTSRQQDSTLARIVNSVQQAQGERAPTQRFVDKFARYYIPAISLLALLVATIPPLLVGAPAGEWLYKALVLLVIACPCALVISTPVTVVSGLAAAARAGILVKGGIYLEEGAKLEMIALDKTGTITFGKPVVTEVISLDEGNKELLRYAASMAAASDHPVSKAIAAYWHEQHTTSTLAVEDFMALHGRGTRASLNGETWYLGNHRMVHELGECSPALESQLEALETQGKSTSILCHGTTPKLIIAVADTVRPSSKTAIAALQSEGIHVVMLTGDNPHTAGYIASEVGITDVHGNQLPEDKLRAMTDYGSRFRLTGMVGDGINDAPALARAGIGFAMGAAGTDVALDTADVALMDDDLGKLPAFIRLSRKTRAILLQNVSFALGIKFVFLALALTGEATLWMAVFADLGATLLVVMNGLRLLRSSRKA